MPDRVLAQAVLLFLTNGQKYDTYRLTIILLVFPEKGGQIAKKLICLLTAFVMMSAMLGQGMAVAVETEDLNIDADSEAKVYSNATLEDDFADDAVLVIMNSDASLDIKDYTVDDFPEVDGAAVRDLSTGAGQKVKQQCDAMMAAAVSRTAVPETVDVERIEKYNQILSIELENPGKENVLAAIEKLEKRDDILYVGPNFVYSLCSTTSLPNDTYVNDQWALEKIQLPEAWEITTGTSTVLVGIIDSGIDASHPDLVGKVNVELSGDFTGTFAVTNESIDVVGHGTHVAGIITAARNNNTGVAGVCQNVTLVSLRVVDNSGDVLSDAVANAIDYAEAMNIPIINMSFGRYTSYPDILAYGEILENYSGLAVCSAGNQNGNIDNVGHYPSGFDFPHVLAVGASTETDTKEEDSDYGKQTVDIFAPGASILSCYPTDMCEDGTHDVQYTVHKANGYHYMTGTSMATPYVTGVAALMLSVNPNLTPAEIRWIIMLSCDKVDALTNYCVTGGRLNAYNAVSNANMYTVMSNNLSREVEISRGEYKWFKFTASTAGSYMFYTEYTESELDTVGELFSELVADNSTEGRLLYHDDISSSDDGDPDYNFYFAKYMEAGETVYLRVSAYENGNCILRIVKR